MGNEIGLAIVRAALRLIEADGEATGQRLRRVEYLLRRALSVLEDGEDR